MEKAQQESKEINILDDLDDLDKAIIKLKIEGLNVAQISEKVKKHRDTVTKRLQKVKVEQAIKELQKTALQILIDAQSDAARTLRNIMKNGTDENKIKAAKEILKGVLSDKIDLSGDINIVYADSQDKEL